MPKKNCLLFYFSGFKFLRANGLLLLLLLLSVKSMAQTDTEFWFAIPEVTTGHFLGGNNPPVSFRLTTLDEPATVTISAPVNPAFLPIEVNMDANQFQTINLTPFYDEIVNNQHGVVLNRGLQIESSAPINAYYEIQTQNNPDIFSLKGVFSLGNEFVVPGQRTFNNGNYDPPARNHFVIVATEDNTIVTIDLANPIVNFNNTNELVEIVLNKGETWSARSNGAGVGQKIGGALINSSKPIAVTIADDSVADGGCRDLVGDQIVPVGNVGTFYAVPIGPIGQGGDNDYIYIWPTEDNTEIFINNNPVAVATRDKGEFYRYTASGIENVLIETSNNSYVLHITGFGCERGWALVPPVECTGSRTVTFNRTTNEAFFLSIIVSEGFQNDFIINGDATLIDGDDFVVVPGTNGDYLTALIEIPDAPVNQPITVSNINSIFHLAVVNGGASTGCRYGYFSAFGRLNLGEDQLVCKGEEITFTASFAYDTYLWNNDPTETGVFFTTADTGWVYVAVTLGACTLTDSVFVSNFPQPEFLLAQDTAYCSNEDLLLTVDAGGNFTSYLWSNGSTDQAITINSPGTYWVDVIDEFGCALSDTSVVSALTIPSFELSAPLPPAICAKDTIPINLDGDFEFTWLIDSTLSIFTGANVLAFPNLTKNYLVVGMDQNECRDTINIPLNVNPLPTGNFNAGNATICPHDSVALEISFLSGTEPFSFAFDSLGSTLIKPKATIGDTTFFVNLAGNYQLLNISDANNCSNEFENIFSLSHFNLPTVEVSVSDTVVCVNQTLNLEASGATNYSWIFGNGLNQNALQEVSANPTEASIYRVVGTDDNGCRDTSETFVNVVFPPIPDFDFNTNNGCDTLTVNFSNLTAGEWRFFEWDFGNAVNSTDTTDISVFYNSTGTFQVVLSAFVNDNCFEEIAKDITVHPNPTADFSFETVCQLEETIFSNESVDNDGPIITSSFWQFGDGNSANNTNPTHTFSNFGNFDVKLLVNTEFCADSVVKVVIVRPKPTADFDNDFDEGCQPLLVNFSALGEIDDSFSWNFGNGQTSNNEQNEILFQNLTDASVEYSVSLRTESAFGCSDTLDKVITVRPKPTADFDIDIEEGCTPLAVNFTQNSTLIDNLNWTFGNESATTLGNFERVFDNITDEPIIVPVQLITTTEFNCKDTTSTQIEVFPAVNALFTLDIDESCSPMPIAVTNQTSGGAGTGFVYTWNFGNVSEGDPSLDEPQLLYLNNDLAVRNETISLLVENSFGCRDSIEQEITIFPKPTADFDIDIEEGCTPLAVNFTQNSTLIDNLNWTFGNESATTLGNFERVFENITDEPIIVPVQLITTTEFNCKDTTSTQIEVFPAVNALFSLDIDESCSPMPIAVSNQTSGGAGTGFVYTWNFGNVSEGDPSLVEPQLLYLNNDLAVRNETISLLVENSFGCRDSIEQEITIFPKPTADFDIDIEEGCTPLAVDFTQNSTLIDNVNWTFGNESATTLGNFERVFENITDEPIIVPVQLITTTEFNCKDTTSTQIEVFPAVNALFSLDIDESCSPMPIAISNQTSGGAGTGFVYTWNFGNVSEGDPSLVEPQLLYLNSDLAVRNETISLLVENSFGCRDSIEQEITIFPKPTADFDIDIEEGCTPLAVNFTQNSTLIDNVNWTFGNESATTLGNFERVFENITDEPIIVPVQLITTTEFNCKDTTSTQIEVFPAVNALFSLDIDESCSPMPIAISNQTSGGAGTGFVYTWNFGNVSEGDPSLVEPQLLYLNNDLAVRNETISLLVENSFGCRDSIEQEITIFPKPTADFDIDIEEGCTPLAVNFTQNSTLIDNVNWTFGNESATNLGNFERVFENITDEPIIVPVQLITTTEFNCKDTTSTQIEVFPAVNALFSLDIDESCSPMPIAVSNQTSGGAGTGFVYTWNFGNVSEGDPSLVEPQLLYLNNDLAVRNETISLLVENSFGCRDSIEQEITIFPKPTADFDIDIEEGCTPLAVNFTQNSTLIDNLNWTFGNESATTLGNFERVFENITDEPIIVPVQLITTTEFNCKDTTSTQIEVFPAVNALFSLDVEQGCSPLPVSITNETSGGMGTGFTYNWDFDGFTAENLPTNPNLTFEHSETTNQTFTISLFAENSFGCADTALNTVTILPTPIANFAADIVEGCTPLAVNFTNESTPVTNTNYTWQFNAEESLSSNNDNVNFTFINNSFSEVATKTVILSAFTDEGCSSTFELDINIFPEVSANFSIPSEVCGPISVIPENLSEGATTFTWNYQQNATTTGFEPELFYNIGSTLSLSHQVTLIAESGFGCVDEATGQILVRPTPAVNFSATPDFMVFPDNQVALQNQTIFQEDWIYEWDFGDGSTENQYQVSGIEYDTWGEYEITLTVTNGNCVGENSKIIVIDPPQPRAFFSGDFMGCEPLAVQFTNDSEWAEQNTWDFGDGTILSGFEPTHIYTQPGVYTVTLTISGAGGESTRTRQNVVIVREKPIADFDANPLTVIVPEEEVSFTNLSIGAISYLWIFDPGQTSEATNPVHAFTSGGRKDITLIAENRWGCLDTITKPAFINAIGNSRFEVPNIFVPSTTGTTGGYFVQGRPDNSVFFPVMSGVVAYEMEIYNRWGERIFRTNELNRGWDGYHNGTLSQQGAYVYKISALFSDGNKINKVGDVTLAW
jgi:PKD repeat protein